MRISVISDLHLELDHNVVLPGGDVLIMAGDIMTVHPMRENRTDAISRRLRKAYIKFCEQELSKYDRVFYVMGNHEFYRETYEETESILRTFLATHGRNVQLSVLGEQSVLSLGTRLIGVTLWSDLKRCDPLVLLNVKEAMNDYQEIRRTDHFDGKFTLKQKFTPEFSASIFREHMAFLEKEVAKGDDLIIVTHHAPSFLSLDRSFNHSLLDYAYATELHDFIAGHPNIRRWIHGHTHHPCLYRIGETIVMSNPRGYKGYETIAKTFDAQKMDFEI